MQKITGLVLLLIILCTITTLSAVAKLARRVSELKETLLILSGVVTHQ